MKPIATDTARAAVDPSSDPMCHCDLLSVSVGQMQQSLKTIAAIAKAAGADRSNRKTTGLLEEISGFAAVNGAYGAFVSAPYPQHAAFEVSALPRGTKTKAEAVPSGA